MRVPPVPESHLEPQQRPLYKAFQERIRTTYSDFTAVREDGALLGPWSVWLQVPRTGEAIRQLIEAVEAMPGLGKSASQVVILLTGSHFGAAYELYAHAAVATQSGLSKAQIAALSAGDIPADLDTEQTVAAMVAKTLLSGGVLPGPLYAYADAELGREGLNHVVFLVALYCVVSMTLNAFDVPTQGT